MESIACNYCHSKSARPFLKNVTSWEHEGSFTVVKCQRCQLVYLNPRPTRTQIGQYYPTQSYWGRDMKTKDMLSQLQREREDAYDFLYRVVLSKKSGGRIVDIGAGTGIFLSKFKELGWQAEGIELSKDAVKFGQRMFKIKMHQGDFLDFMFPARSVDVVTLNNALEHLYDPAKTLRAVYKVLKKGGLVVVTVPNIESLGFTLFGKDWYALQPPRHLYHFSPITLSKMLEQQGFRVGGISHKYWVHNYAALFESFRMKLSPKFEKKPSGGRVEKASQVSLSHSPSMTKEIAKLLFKGMAGGLAMVGAAIGKGETICIWAQKS
ncbi:MAG TPA: class I SAM-dependent methyltransferase [Vitreimonas sp.]|nr:class I SAM-dependent methyltransferase [Vitreimonas sp.]